MKNATQAFVLASGGIDSTTCIAMAVDTFGRENVHAFSVYYGQRHVRELESSRQIATWFRISHQELQLGPQPLSNLTNPEANIPAVSYAELPQGMSPSYHYFRNAQLLSLATAFATAELDRMSQATGFLYTGVHAEDAENWAYADCTPEFIGGMADAIYIGTYGKIRLKAPLLEMSKADVVRKGSSLGAPYNLSWSCYLGGEKHCGTCPTCRARKEAFEIAGIADPTEYL